VLPILHLNGFKIANPTIFACMTDEELATLFTGYGHQVRIVDFSDQLDERTDEALAWAYEQITSIQQQARRGRAPDRPAWPMIILRTPKGMGGIKTLDGKAIEGSWRSHQVPAKDLKSNPKHLAVVEAWLRSYKPSELFGKDGRPIEAILRVPPRRERRMALNEHAFGWKRYRPLDTPDLTDYAVKVQRHGAAWASSMDQLGQYLREVVKRNSAPRNFRIVCPDELESNHLGAVLEATDRQFNWPTPPNTEHTGREGSVMEVLSEHNCQGWLQGYLLTGRCGVFPCYEAFLPIIDGMMNQYCKFLKSSLEVPWRGPIGSLNYILTSEAWRQEHNGYSHQGPGFINNVLTKKGYIYRVYLPPDANCAVSMMDHSLRSTNYINLMIAGKQPMPQWLSLDEAVDHCRAGVSIWRWGSTNDGEDPDIVLAGCGDNLTLEVMAAAQYLRQEAPHWRVRVVNVVRLMVLGIPQKYPSGIDEDTFQRVFPLDAPVIFNFHGYTAAIKQLLWERPGAAARFDINGYREEGTTTTPFDMQIVNRTSRYHIVIQAAQKIARRNPSTAAHADAIIRKYQNKIREHSEYIHTHDQDPSEVTEWKWEGK
jgi:xylulose-5-phosphate/fructose-6-phosphate phosphoketolase